MLDGGYSPQHHHTHRAIDGGKAPALRVWRGKGNFLTLLKKLLFAVRHPTETALGAPLSGHLDTLAIHASPSKASHGCALQARWGIFPMRIFVRLDASPIAPHRRPCFETNTQTSGRALTRAAFSSRSEPMDQPEITFAAGVIAKAPTGRILMVKRTDTGEWAFPGGRLEEGEDAAQAAYREFHEETQYRLGSVGMQLMTRRKDDGQGMVDFVTFLAPVDIRICADARRRALRLSRGSIAMRRSPRIGTLRRSPTAQSQFTTKTRNAEADPR